MTIRFLDLSVKDEPLKRELLQAVDRVLSHGRLVLGPEVEQFEGKVAEIAGTRYAVGMNSGTDALYFSFRALNIGLGDEVIVPALSWIATANAITVTGATPVFVDVGNDLLIDPNRIEEAITAKTRAIAPVHFTGAACDMTAIMEIAERSGLAVVEDAAPAFSARHQGRPVGSFGKVNAFSMNPMKVYGAYGEAGAAVTDDRDLYDKLVSLRYAGTINKENCQTPSLNGRLDTLQAALLLVNLKYLDDRIAKRRKLAEFYSRELADVVGCPVQKEGDRNVWYTYTIVAERRDELQRYLDDHGVETKIQHPFLMPYHTAYANRPPRHSIPRAEHLVDRVLCVPASEKTTLQEAAEVAGLIREFYGASRTPNSMTTAGEKVSV